MADTAIAVTAGSGTNIDARSESTNGDLRQVIVVGDPSANAGVAPVDGTSGLKVDLGADNDVTNAGTFAVQVDGDALTALQLIDDFVYQDDADFTDDTSKFALVGGLYQSTPQSVTDGDVGPLQIDANGRVLAKLGANSGVDIGDVDITSLVPGTAATNFGKAEDAAHSSGDVGVAALAVRRDAKAAGAGTDGDYATLNVTANGDLRVDGGQIHVFESAPTISASAYAEGDVFGGEIEITNAARVSGGGGMITDVVMAVEDDGSADFAANNIELWFFKSNPAGTYTDNAALAVSDADAFEIERVVKLNEKWDGGNITVLSASNLNISYNCDATSLWVVPVIRAAVTPDATDAVQFRIKMIRD